MSALLPCPFCGGDADYLPDRLMAPGSPPPVFCNGCHASALDDEAWNQRAAPAEIEALRAEVERAAVVVDEMADFEADGRAVIALRGAAVVLRALKEGT